MQKEVRDEIVRYMLERPGNRHLDGGERYFDVPLVGFASTADPLYEEYNQTMVSCEEMTPRGPARSVPREEAPGGRGLPAC